ncbi:MAG: hypothetical protein SynsKO_12050 [Synoicihabitans sp.]
MNIDLGKLPRSTVLGAVAFIAICSLVAWWSWQQAGQAERADRTLRMREMQWKGLQSSEPAPDAQVADRLEKQLAVAKAAVEELRAQLGAGNSDPIRNDDPPEQRADAFFVLAQFMERQQLAAQNAGVELADEEAFAFSAHRNSGPPDEHIALVHRQMLVVDELLNALWRANPVSLTQVWREDPTTKIPAADVTGVSSRSGRGSDWFEWSPQRSLASKGNMDTLAIRVGFVGRTTTLRRFLALLAESPAPLVVREIGVQPLGTNGQAAGRRRSLEDLFRDESPENSGAENASNTVPIIPANDAEFIVTVEYLDFVGPAEARQAEREGNP